MNKYDYIIVGSGLYGCVCAHELTKAGKKCLVIEKRSHSGGNVYCEEHDGINIHKYGAHIFHTSDKVVWDYVNQFVEFNNYINSPVARYKDELYNLPFNMNTFASMWGIKSPKEAKAIIDRQRLEIKGIPANLEEQAISLVGRDIFEKLIKGYTEKQWGRSCKELPSFIIRRLPVRYTFDNNYFSDRYQGIPIGGYNRLINQLLSNVEVCYNVDFNVDRNMYKALGKTIIYTGMIDAYFDYVYGALEYRGLRFKTDKFEEENYQGVAVVNYTDSDVGYTRTIEHKHFEFGTQPVTYVTKEYPINWQPGEEAYYPINDVKNQEVYSKYQQLASQEEKVVFGGRLAEYKYYDMDDVIASALTMIRARLIG